MDAIRQQFAVRFEYPVHFTRGVFDPHNPLLASVLAPGPGGPARALFVLDGGLVAADPGLPARLAAYLAQHAETLLAVAPPLVLPGGEQAKNDPEQLTLLQGALARHGLCRHSYVVAVGGGALLDVAGFAAATVHRGLRLVRLPSTVLAQDDAGVGVKNGVNAFGRKNFLGAFAPPFAVVNDLELLQTLPARERRGGMSEAVKVAVVRDAELFAWLEQAVERLRRFEAPAVETLVRRSAAVHLAHIREGGDPFELGSARPLDFGHWCAHRLEELTQGGLRHGEAVALGIAVDTDYAAAIGLLTDGARRRVLALLGGLGFALEHPALAELDVVAALDAFREHLGGELTITLPDRLGHGIEVHEIELELMRRQLLRRAGAPAAAGRRGDATTAVDGSGLEVG